MYQQETIIFIILLLFIFNNSINVSTSTSFESIDLKNGSVIFQFTENGNSCLTKFLDYRGNIVVSESKDSLDSNYTYFNENQKSITNVNPFLFISTSSLVSNISLYIDNILYNKSSVQFNTPSISSSTTFSYQSKLQTFLDSSLFIYNKTNLRLNTPIISNSSNLSINSSSIVYIKSIDLNYNTNFTVNQNSGLNIENITLVGSNFNLDRVQLNIDNIKVLSDPPDLPNPVITNFKKSNLLWSFVNVVSGLNYYITRSKHTISNTVFNEFINIDIIGKDLRDDGNLYTDLRIFDSNFYGQTTITQDFTSLSITSSSFSKTTRFITKHTSSINLYNLNISASIEKADGLVDFYNINLYNTGITITKSAQYIRIYSKEGNNNIIIDQLFNSTLPYIDASFAIISISNSSDVSFGTYAISNEAYFKDSNVTINSFFAKKTHSIFIDNSNISILQISSFIFPLSNVIISQSFFSINLKNAPSFTLQIQSSNSTSVVVPAPQLVYNFYLNNNSTLFINNDITSSTLFMTSDADSYFDLAPISQSNVILNETFRSIKDIFLEQQTKLFINCNTNFQFNSFTLNSRNSQLFVNCPLIQGLVSFNIQNTTISSYLPRATLDFKIQTDVLSNFTFFINDTSTYQQVSLNSNRYNEFLSSIKISYIVTSLRSGVEFPIIKFKDDYAPITGNISIDNKFYFVPLNNYTGMQFPFFNAYQYYRSPFIYVRFDLGGYIDLSTSTPKPSTTASPSSSNTSKIIYSVVGVALGLTLISMIVLFKVLHSKKGKRQKDIKMMSPTEEMYIKEKGKWIGMLSPHTEVQSLTPKDSLNEQNNNNNNNNNNNSNINNNNINNAFELEISNNKP